MYASSKISVPHRHTLPGNKKIAKEEGRDRTMLTRRVDEVQVDEDYTFDEFRAEFPTARTFPQIIVDDNKIGGYTELKALTEVED